MYANIHMAYFDTSKAMWEEAQAATTPAQTASMMAVFLERHRKESLASPGTCSCDVCEFVGRDSEITRLPVAVEDPSVDVSVWYRQMDACMLRRSQRLRSALVSALQLDAGDPRMIASLMGSRGAAERQSPAVLKHEGETATSMTGKRDLVLKGALNQQIEVPSPATEPAAFNIDIPDVRRLRAGPVQLPSDPDLHQAARMRSLAGRPPSAALMAACVSLIPEDVGAGLVGLSTQILLAVGPVSGYLPFLTRVTYELWAGHASPLTTNSLVSILPKPHKDDYTLCKSYRNIPVKSVGSKSMGRALSERLLDVMRTERFITPDIFNVRARGTIRTGATIVLATKLRLARGLSTTMYIRDMDSCYYYPSIGGRYYRFEGGY